MTEYEDAMAALRRRHGLPEPMWRVPSVEGEALRLESVAGNLHVRQASQHHLRMPIRPRDYDRGYGDDPFIFVTGRRGNYAIRGWATPNSVTDIPFSDPHGWGPVRLVPVDRLTALSEL